MEGRRAGSEHEEEGMPCSRIMTKSTMQCTTTTTDIYFHSIIDLGASKIGLLWRNSTETFVIVMV